ncbi:MAG: hypothetical protein CW716_00905 [Candidatus Bathyarchaeum sp.]|nr:MAG: hypothetical protein CW716_00905 [Candidatus Bathyarchaeum sp.]
MASKRIALMSALLLVLCLSASVETISAQTGSQYWVTVNPVTSSSILYGNVEKNWTIPFQALWSYGENSGQVIESAKLTIEVKTLDNTSIANITETTNSTGFVTLYYISSNPAVLTFTPTSLVTQDETLYNSSLFEDGQSVYGLQQNSLTVYWDTFDASLVSTNTDTQGVTAVSINVTYMMVPEEGLTIPDSSPEQVFPKIAHGRNVTINGVEAEETSVSGVYTANFSTWLPTTYMIVEVSQDGWLPAHIAFSFDHVSNSVMWMPALAILLVIFAGLVLFRLFKKTEDNTRFGNAGFPFIGGVLLALATFISLYWGAVGLDGTLSGFDWLWLAAFGLLSFGFGFAGSILSVMKRKQAVVIFAVCVPLLANVIAIKSALDGYQLAAPWLIIVPSFIISVLSGILISNADKHFKS